MVCQTWPRAVLCVGPRKRPPARNSPQPKNVPKKNRSVPTTPSLDRHRIRLLLIVSHRCAPESSKSFLGVTSMTADAELVSMKKQIINGEKTKHVFLCYGFLPMIKLTAPVLHTVRRYPCNNGRIRFFSNNNSTLKDSTEARWERRTLLPSL